MKSKFLYTLVCLLLTSFLLTGCNSSDYKKATQLYSEGNYEEALALFTKLGDYEDSAQMAAACQKGLMYQVYAEEISALSAGEWFFEGYTEDSLNRLTFDATTAIISSAFFDGNGAHEGSSEAFEFTIDKHTVSFDSPTGEVVLNYMVSGNEATIITEGYFTQEMIESEIQGTWFVNRPGFYRLITINDRSATVRYVSGLDGSISPVSHDQEVVFGFGSLTGKSFAAGLTFKIKDNKPVCMDFYHIMEKWD